MYSCGANWIFSIITPIFSLMILQKSLYYVDLLHKKHVFLLSLLNCLIFFVETVIRFFQNDFMNRKVKKYHLFT